MTKLRRRIAEGAEDSENEAVREMADQYEVVQEELENLSAYRRVLSEIAVWIY